MKTKFTKGKWELIKLRGEVIGVATEENIDGNVICEMPTLNESLKNWNANALLISKAPEMFEMLEETFNLTDKLQMPTEFEISILRNKLYKILKEATEL